MSKKTTQLQREFSLLDDSDESDTEIQSSQSVVLGKRPRDFAVPSSSAPRPKKRTTLLAAHDRYTESLDTSDSDTGLTSYQEYSDCPSSPDVFVASDEFLSETNDIRERKRAAEEQLLTEFRSRELQGKSEWKAVKKTKLDRVVCFPLTPATRKDDTPSRSCFLITITDNVTIIPATHDNWFDLYSQPYHRKLIVALNKWVSGPIENVIKPGTPVSDMDYANRLVRENVVNVRVVYVRERSTEKGQAHLHGFVTVNYINKGGFYPHIDKSKARKIMNESMNKGKSEDEPQYSVYIGADHVKANEHDTLKYMLVPAGEKLQDKKVKKYKKYAPTSA